MTDLVALGVVVRAQGLRGQVRVNPYGIGPEHAARLGDVPVFLRGGSESHQTKIREQRWHRGIWIVGFEDCRTRDQAEELVGREVCLAEEDRPELPEDEYYVDDLVGMKVVDVNSGAVLGEAFGVRPSAGADLLEVCGPDGRKFCIPVVKAMIRGVDLSSGTISVDLPDGLIGLNE